MVHAVGPTVLTGGPSCSPRVGRAQVAVTVATSNGPANLVVELSDDPDPGRALAALGAVAGSTPMVVDRTGTPFRGAVIGRDLLRGDHLVPADGRGRPALAALTGPSRGGTAVADRELVIGRGGRFGDQTVDDTEVSQRPHDLELLVVPVDGSNALRALEAAGRWLPHAGAHPRGDEAGQASSASAWSGPVSDRWSVAFVELAPDRPSDAVVLEQRLARPGRTLVWVGRSAADLPPGCAATVEITDGGGSATWRRTAAAPDGVSPVEVGQLVPDLATGRVLDDLARLLAPLVALTADGTNVLPVDD